MLLVCLYSFLIILLHLIVVSVSSFCDFLSLCVASVVLALVFMPGLNIGLLPFLRSLLKSVLLCGCRLFVPSVCAFACVSVSC